HTAVAELGQRGNRSDLAEPVPLDQTTSDTRGLAVDDGHRADLQSGAQHIAQSRDRFCGYVSRRIRRSPVAHTNERGENSGVIVWRQGAHGDGARFGRHELTLVARHQWLASLQPQPRSLEPGRKTGPKLINELDPQRSSAFGEYGA